MDSIHTYSSHCHSRRAQWTFVQPYVHCIRMVFFFSITYTKYVTLLFGSFKYFSALKIDINFTIVVLLLFLASLSGTAFSDSGSSGQYRQIFNLIMRNVKCGNTHFHWLHNQSLVIKGGEKKTFRHWMSCPGGCLSLHFCLAFVFYLVAKKYRVEPVIIKKKLQAYH